MKSFFFLAMLAFFLTFSTSTATAATTKFDTRLSEFILKNASALVPQIKARKGLGYESLQNQLVQWGCPSDALSSLTLPSVTLAYELHNQINQAISDCRSTTQDHHLESLLGNKPVYLIIAGESLRSPMSYFGHSSLLFLNPDNFYFSPVISFVAPTEDLNSFEQLTKGGFSYIPAKLDVLPLHQIIDGYNHKESRDLRFIKLDEDIFNSKKLIEQLEAFQNQPLAYNFFLKNCSTYIFQSLESSCHCLDEAPAIISPIELERSVIKNTHTKEFTLESLYQRFNKSYQSLSDSGKAATREIVLNHEKKPYPTNNKEVGNTAVLASRLSFESYRRPYPSYEDVLNTYGNNHGLLENLPVHTDSDLDLRDSLYPSSLSTQTYDGGINLKLSAIDFDHFEQRQSTYKIAQIDLASVTLQHERNTTEVKSLEALNIQSITPMNFITHSPSWKFRLGADRTGQDELTAQLSFGLGVAFNISKLTIYSIPSIKLSDQLSYPVYSGAIYKSHIASMKLEIENLSDAKLSLFHRHNRFLGMGYHLVKAGNEQIRHEIGLSIYF